MFPSVPIAIPFAISLLGPPQVCWNCNLRGTASTIGITRTAAIERVATSVAKRVARRSGFIFLFSENASTMVEGIRLAIGVYSIPRIPIQTPIWTTAGAEGCEGVADEWNVW